MPAPLLLSRFQGDQVDSQVTPQGGPQTDPQVNSQLDSHATPQGDPQTDPQANCQVKGGLRLRCAVTYIGVYVCVIALASA